MTHTSKLYLRSPVCENELSVEFYLSLFAIKPLLKLLKRFRIRWAWTIYLIDLIDLLFRREFDVSRPTTILHEIFMHKFRATEIISKRVNYIYIRYMCIYDRYSIFIALICTYIRFIDIYFFSKVRK